jgi:tetratricopeptide (TPR) repeat protein
MQRLAAEEANLRAALHRCASEPDATVDLLRMAFALGEWWIMRGHLAEGRTWLELAQQRLDDRVEPGLRASMLEATGDLAFRQGDFASAKVHHEQALDLRTAAGDEREAARSFRTLGNVADEQGDLVAAERYFQQAFGLYRSLKDGWGQAATLNNLGLVARKAGDYAAATRYLSDSLRRFQAIGAPWAVGISHANLGDVAVDRGDPTVAHAHYERSLSVARELEDREGLVYALTGLADTARLQRRYPEARAALEEALPVLRELGAKLSVAEWFESFGALLAASGESLEAARLLGAAGALRDELASPMPSTRRASQDLLRLQLLTVLGDAAYTDALQYGAALPWDVVADDLLASYVN